jgi:hypothetical protein
MPPYDIQMSGVVTSYRYDDVVVVKTSALADNESKWAGVNNGLKNIVYVPYYSVLRRAPDG